MAQIGDRAPMRDALVPARQFERREHGAVMRAVLWMLLALVASLLAAPSICRVIGLAPDEALLPAPGRRVTIGDGRFLNVVERGEGPPIVLVHGLPSNVGDWADLPEQLVRRGHRVVVYDRVGYGHSSRDRGDAADAYTYASSARDLAALIEALELQGVTLVGWSYGGGVVQRLVEDDPARIARIVLLGSVGPLLSPAPEDAIGRLARSPLGGPLFRWLVAVPPLARHAIAEPIAGVFSGAEHVPPGWLDRTVAQLALPGTIDAWLLEERRHDPAQFRPESIRRPALVLHGSDDRSVPLAVGEDLARRIPGAKLVRFEGGSHMLPATHGEALAERIEAWIEGGG